MTTFDIVDIVNRYQLDTKQLAEVLFPTNAFKKQALDRVLRYEAPLNVQQLIDLSNYIGIPIGELFDSWYLSKAVIVKDSVKVVFFENNYYYSVYKDDVLVAQIVDNGSRLTLSDFFEIINKYLTT